MIVLYIINQNREFFLISWFKLWRGQQIKSLRREKVGHSITESLSTQWDFRALLRAHLKFKLMNKK